ncbi:hypothetical protein HOV56_gp37 [Nitrosopumilus spindle-shaped virus]|uniref:Uncharacterized protein n=1 Tax=Nitrosopumilus spindle-shaped virus TaxID=2508184 RepID=A0A514K2X8_9VIRU|nr:hypothetical protein HOV56_gp37 [Nitrosopumilus spindle-shaped virus]YP_010772866.1 hypothetical protein QIT54_gp36 [Nitrosopumilus spindle-shaped virus]QDI73926.1 hypothetical protein [Nitrosopumilus spindle-shaped virus]QDI73974.1 hypothetical protein [Nitrosopumilus spindle-shaped virus]
MDISAQAAPIVGTAAGLAVNLAAIDTVNRVVSKNKTMRKGSHRSMKKAGGSKPAVFQTPSTPKATGGLGKKSKHAPVKTRGSKPVKAFGKNGLSGRDKGKLYGMTF